MTPRKQTTNKPMPEPTTSACQVSSGIGPRRIGRDELLG